MLIGNTRHGRGTIIPYRRYDEPALPPADSGDERGLVEVHRCDQAEAVVVKGLLETEGIPTLFQSRFAHSVHPFSVGAQGEIVILVPRAESARARQLLAGVLPGQDLPESERS